jgi:prepilin-type N-terminal cleavage/methylation domain-containing protein
MSSTETDDEGFGLVEVMVSMMLFAILLLATIAVLLSAIKVSARNSAVESATQWAAEQVDTAHASVAGLDYSKACPKWTDLVSAGAPANRHDARGLTMKMVVTADSTPVNCLTATVPPVVQYKVTVVEAAHPTHVLATSTTKIALGLE